MPRRLAFKSRTQFSIQRGRLWNLIADHMEETLRDEANVLCPPHFDCDDIADQFSRYFPNHRYSARYRRVSNQEPIHYAVEAVASLLLPYKGTGEPYYDDEEFPDLVGPDQPIRDILKEVLKVLNVDGMSGCRLCLS